MNAIVLAAVLSAQGSPARYETGKVLSYSGNLQFLVLLDNGEKRTHSLPDTVPAKNPRVRLKADSLCRKLVVGRRVRIDRVLDGRMSLEGSADIHTSFELALITTGLARNSRPGNDWNRVAEEIARVAYVGDWEGPIPRAKPVLAPPVYQRKGVVLAANRNYEVDFLSYRGDFKVRLRFLPIYFEPPYPVIDCQLADIRPSSRSSVRTKADRLIRLWSTDGTWTAYVRPGGSVPRVRLYVGEDGQPDMPNTLLLLGLGVASPEASKEARVLETFAKAMEQGHWSK